MSHRSIVRASAFVLLAACSSSSNDNDDVRHREVALAVHASLLDDIDVLLASAKDLQTAAPPGGATGWSAEQDSAAIVASKEAWVRARTAYEHVEGALAPLFPQIDSSLDGRYDDQLANLTAGDDNLFDGHGITGLHAVERILWSDMVPPHVITFEKVLPGYRPPAFPASQAEAAAYKTELCAKLVADAQQLHDDWKPQAAQIDIAGAFDGLIDLMLEQREKVNKAATNEEESRYSQRTMTDIRDNLAGTSHIYGLFATWLQSQSDPTRGARGDGKAIHARVEGGFAKLGAAYAKVSGDAIPQPPATWRAEGPTPQDLASPFGELYTAVSDAVDPTVETSVVAAMNDAAELLGLRGATGAP
jgi:iron uptake system component EfeO